MPQYIFTPGRSYSREGIRSAIGMNPAARGGKVDTGLFTHNGAHFILCGVGTPGRTGHDYGNCFVGDQLSWSAKTGSRLGHKSIQALLRPGAEIHVFFRENNRSPFIYCGAACAVESEDSEPVKILWAFDRESTRPVESDPQEIPPGSFPAGKRRTVQVNVFERDPQARAACLRERGLQCACCGSLLTDIYGELAEGFIHVHHVVPVSTVEEGYKIDPRTDLVPVCPNCHAMIHRANPPHSVEYVRSVIAELRRKR